MSKTTSESQIHKARLLLIGILKRDEVVDIEDALQDAAIFTSQQAREDRVYDAIQSIESLMSDLKNIINTLD